MVLGPEHVEDYLLVHRLAYVTLNSLVLRQVSLTDVFVYDGSDFDHFLLVETNSPLSLDLLDSIEPATEAPTLQVLPSQLHRFAGPNEHLASVQVQQSESPPLEIPIIDLH